MPGPGGGRYLGQLRWAGWLGTHESLIGRGPHVCYYAHQFLKNGSIGLKLSWGWVNDIYKLVTSGIFDWCHSFHKNFMTSGLRTQLILIYFCRSPFFLGGPNKYPRKCFVNTTLVKIRGSKSGVFSMEVFFRS